MRPQIPKTKTQTANPIDAFILARLEAKGLTFSPPADRATLMRRAYFDLTGLPPEPAEVKAFLADNAPDAYEKLIEKLLASPRYGERWGRYWLDLAGYADSEGKREQDLPRPHAWRYRDYVVRSFNADKPYDRFLTEQLAGDELADYASAKEITPELYDNLVATGFLRMTPDATWANITGFIPDRVEVMADQIDVLGSAVLGLTMKCARCHDAPTPGGRKRRGCGQTPLSDPAKHPVPVVHGPRRTSLCAGAGRVRTFRWCPRACSRYYLYGQIYRFD